jgi:hypothetical protein
MKAINDEWTEFIEATTLTEKICEFSDVVHTIIKYYGYAWMIPPIIIYFFCCIFSPYTAIKHGYRQFNHGCIRNFPHCRKKNHVCKTSTD